MDGAESPNEVTMTEAAEGADVADASSPPIMDGMMEPTMGPMMK